eukprot:2969922-Prorocentrum_lima.AAC.1
MPNALHPTTQGPSESLDSQAAVKILLLPPRTPRATAWSAYAARPPAGAQHHAREGSAGVQ